MTKAIHSKVNMKLKSQGLGQSQGSYCSRDFVMQCAEQVTPPENSPVLGCKLMSFFLSAASELHSSREPHAARSARNWLHLILNCPPKRTEPNDGDGGVNLPLQGFISLLTSTTLEREMIKAAQGTTHNKKTPSLTLIFS